jgi:hypothetical protein
MKFLNILETDWVWECGLYTYVERQEPGSVVLKMVLKMRVL